MANLPPHDPLAEQALLGCLFLANDQAEVASMLSSPDWPKPEDFFDLRHRKIVATALDLVSRGEPMDMVALCGSLGTAGTASVGGITYISSLSDQTTVASAWSSYAKIIRSRAKAREIIKQCRKAIEEVADSPDPDALAAKLAVDLGDISQRGSSAGPVPMSEVVDRAITFIEDAHSGKSVIPTGFPDLDRQLNGGFDPGAYVLIAARTSVGKTAFAMNIATNVAKWLYDHKDTRQVYVFSYEMTVEKIGERLLNAESELAIAQSKDTITAAEHNRAVCAANRLRNLPMQIDERTDLTAKQIVSAARAAHARQPLALAVLDYIQLVEPEDSKSDNRATEVGRISQTIKNAFKQMRVPVLVVAQLNRNADEPGRIPRKSDLRESGSLEQDAQFIGLLYTKANVADKAPIKQVLMRVAKDRSNGTDYDIEFMYRGAFYKFYSAARQGPQE